MDIKVPTRPYLKRYLHRKHPMPYRLRMDDLFGAYIYHLLRDGREDANYDKFTSKYSVKFTVRVKKWQVFDKGAYKLTSWVIVRFNIYLEKMFQRELFAYLEQCEEAYNSTSELFTIRNSPFTIKTSIYRFLEKYNIDQSELSYQTLNKSYYRYKQKTQKKLPSILSSEIFAAQHSFGNRKLA